MLRRRALHRPERRQLVRAVVVLRLPADAVLGAFAPAARAGCRDVLRIEDDRQEEAPRLTLSDCDVDARFDGRGRTAGVMLRLKESAANAWRAALGADGALAAALQGGKLAVRSDADSIPATV